MAKDVEHKEDTKREELRQILIDAIIERPISFSTHDGRFYSIYQPSLGISLLCEPILKAMKIDEGMSKFNESWEMIRLVKEHRKDLLRLVAYHTFKRRSDVLQADMVEKRIEELDKEIESDDLVTIFSYILSWGTWSAKLQKYFKLDKEKETRMQVQELQKKKRDGGVSFGGRSVYGSMIDFACERYGWQVGYVVWGVSITNLNMMMADSVSSAYISKKELDEAGISTDGEYLSADDPDNWLRIKQLAKTLR